jgi:hypothetical protein
MTQSYQFIFGNKQFIVDQMLDSKGVVVPFQAGTSNCCLLQSIQTGSGAPLVFNFVGSGWGLKQNIIMCHGKGCMGLYSSSPFASSSSFFLIHMPCIHFQTTLRKVPEFYCSVVC